MEDFLELPNTELWNSRMDWFNNQLEVNQGIGSFFVSEQASALTMDLQLNFCVGAWISVIVLSLTIIDAHLREVELPGFKGSTANLIKEMNLEKELTWLRKKRNNLIHINVENPELTVDKQWENREELKKDAENAVIWVFKIMFMSPGT